MTTSEEVIIEKEKVEGEVDNNDTEVEGDFIKVPKKDFESMNQTIGSLKRENKDLKKPKTETVDTTKTSASNDLGEKAYLIANGIKTPAEIEFVKKLKTETGKDVDALLQTTYFQTEFKTFQEKQATSAATPTGKDNRSQNSQIDSVDYWIAKGELPPVEQVKLRREVVNAKIAKDKQRGIFYNSK
jgi:hypothetical protein